MNLDFFIIGALTIFIAIPARIFYEIGLDPEEISTIFFLLTWILLFSIIHLVVTTVLRGIKYIYWNFSKNLQNPAYQNLKQTKNKQKS